MRIRLRRPHFILFSLCFAESVHRIAADEPGDSRKAQPVQRRLVDEKLQKKKLERVQGISKIAGPWPSHTGEVIPNVLMLLDTRFDVETELSERGLLVALQKHFLLHYFSGPQIKVINSEFQYPGSKFSVIYAEGGQLGQFTLSLRGSDGEFKAWILVHAQVQPRLEELDLNRIDVKDILDRSRERREGDRREAERLLQDAINKSHAEDAVEQPAAAGESK